MCFSQYSVTEAYLLKVLVPFDIRIGKTQYAFSSMVDYRAKISLLTGELG